MKHFRLISFKKLNASSLRKACNYFDYDANECAIDICISSDNTSSCLVDFCINDNDTGRCAIDSCGLSDEGDNSCLIDDCGVDSGCGLDKDDDEHCSFYDYGCPQDKPQQT